MVKEYLKYDLSKDKQAVKELNEESKELIDQLIRAILEVIMIKLQTNESREAVERIKRVC